MILDSQKVLSAAHCSIVWLSSLLAGWSPLFGEDWSCDVAKLTDFHDVSDVSRVSPPRGFPSSGNGLWYTQEGSIWTQEYLPIGNGYLGAALPGGTHQEATQLNIESLWSGGPFQDPAYNGGNNVPSQQGTIAHNMDNIRKAIFTSPTGEIETIEEICTPAGAYGSFSGAGYLLATLKGRQPVYDYRRWLDMDEAVVRTFWSQGTAHFMRESFCSHPTQSCTQYLNTTGNNLPDLTYAFSVEKQLQLPTPNVTCIDNATLSVRGYVAIPGMLYEILGKVRAPYGSVTCNTVKGSILPNATITVSGASEAWITWVGGTNYDMFAGDAAHNFTFRGPDPHKKLLSLLSSATPLFKTYRAMLSEHVADYKAILSPFSLSLGQTVDLSKPTDELISSYRTGVGNPYVEWLIFNYGRYLLVGSARGVLPANLQGKWADGSTNPWGADYHSNINIQMNYWAAEMTNLNLSRPLFDYIEQTWIPRGIETAQILYNISKGWVTHDEMNIFGHTGMKLLGNSALWADYPESNAWMMAHVWDHFDYTGDVGWWKRQGWPLIKSVASFHLEKLVEDQYFHDSTLVTVPCNSPEQRPITFGCSHAQQLIWQLLSYVERGFIASGDLDVPFLDAVIAKREILDQGLRIGSWGQLQEWKVDFDRVDDTHRHLSHLFGLYPGFSLASYTPALQSRIIVDERPHLYTKEELLRATEISLIHRGNGTGPDGDTGWEKVWRAAVWAQLGKKDNFYHQLTYAIERNFAANLFSIYYPDTSVFQIDANLGYPAAVLNALLQAPDVPSNAVPLQVTLLPALPAAWPSGHIKNARLRGGITVDIYWSKGKLKEVILVVDEDLRKERERDVVVNYLGKSISAFRTRAGVVRRIVF